MEHTDLELYIQIRDGQPYEHPIFGNNLRQAFPDVDTNNLPDTFAKFVRVAAPTVDTFEVYEGVAYEWVDGAVKDVHAVRPMTEEERAAKIAQLEAEAEQTRISRIAFIDEFLTTETDEAARTLWFDCRAAHEAWVLESVAPTIPQFPRFPIKSGDGNWAI